MKHVVPHDLGQERAKKAAESALVTYAQKFQKYSPKIDWSTSSKATISFQVKGFTLSGALEVLERSIEMDLDVPFILRPFKGQALGVIEGEIKEWIQKAKNGAV
jgi:methionyl-tRNA formyltransferase